ncbi:MAG: prepilin-type N-terminal cleavage/methylation domain-containing protein, partial [Clostridium sp.]|nr:prepilin-type N-terminal cleavage/methylation domain-containing protein [Clostridium sp.]
MKKKKGFTLVELIAVIAISAIFGSIVIAISITSGRLF